MSFLRNTWVKRLSLIHIAQVDLEMLDQRGRRAWDTYTARLGDALDAAACRPCLNDPTFMVERLSLIHI